jgi:hypothetical protein
VTPTVQLTWVAVTQATSYAIYDSTTGPTSGYSLYASGVSGTTYTTASLPSGNYWFEIAASIGSNWVGPRSSAATVRTILLLTCS